MNMTDSDVFAAYATTKVDGNHDFYRCYKCNSLFTREQEVMRLRAMSDDSCCSVGICECGSLKYGPGWPAVYRGRWFRRWLGGNEWLHGNVVRYVVKLVLARGIAPWAEKHYPSALPMIERLVRYREV